MTLKITGKAFPEKDALLELTRSLKEIEKPLLIHCQSGADRTGLASVIYRHVVEGESIQVARKELSLKHGHLSSQSGFLFGQYSRSAEHISFETWVEEYYEKEDFENRFNRSLNPNYILGKTLYTLKSYL